MMNHEQARNFCRTEGTVYLKYVRLNTGEFIFADAGGEFEPPDHKHMVPAGTTPISAAYLKVDVQRQHVEPVERSHTLNMGRLPDDKHLIELILFGSYQDWP